MQCTSCINYVGVNIINDSDAKSSLSGSEFEYKTTDNLLLFMKIGKLTGLIPTSEKFRFINNHAINLNCNFVGAAVAGTVATAGGAIATSAATGAAAMVTLPGEAAVAATLGGAGVTAAEAAVAAGGLTLGTILAPVAIGAALGAGIA